MKEHRYETRWAGAVWLVTARRPSKAAAKVASALKLPVNCRVQVRGRNGKLRHYVIKKHGPRFSK